MSLGHFQIQGYSIRNMGSQIQIHSDEKDLSLRIAGAWHNEEPLQITVLSDIQARVETESSILRLNYIDDENEPNGQIEIDVKIPGDDLASWTTLLNGVPREVIRVFVAVLNGDDEAEEYRVLQGQNNNNNNNNNFNNNNNNSQRTVTINNAVSIQSNIDGGKRRKPSKKTRRRRNRRT